MEGYDLGPRGGVAAIRVTCACDRGRIYSVDPYNLRRGASTRCDTCAKQKAVGTRKMYWGYADVLPDDDHRTRLLNRIASCISRCHNPRAKQYPSYGGRGIFVHGPWLEDRVGFLRHLLTLPGWDQPELELDRIHNDRGYEPGNLRFTTRTENVGNRRTVARLQRRIHELEREVHDLRHRLRRAEEQILGPLF